MFPSESEVLERIVAWASGVEAIRAVFLTSSRARPDGPVDVLSDYDIVFVVTAEFEIRGDWPLFYGAPLTRWGDEEVRHGLVAVFRSVVYEDGVKVDYSLWPTALLTHIAEAPELPEDLDVGYRTLLDKDRLTAALRPPSYRAHIPARPTQAEFEAVVEEFWWQTTYIAKALWRGEVVFAKWVLDADTKLQSLRRVLEWKIEILNDWSAKPGVWGRGLERMLPSSLAEELAATYVGSGQEENWESLYRTIHLFRNVAQDVAADLGLTYPPEIDARMMNYLEKVRALSPKAG